MRVVPTSGGLEWDSDGSCYLDAIPGPPGRRAKPLALDEVIAAVRSEGAEPMIWHNWTPDMSPTHDLRAFTGVAGLNIGAGVVLRYIYKRGTQAVDGLYVIEAMDHLPPAIAGAVLAATVAQPLPDPAGYANVLPNLVGRYVDNQEVPDPAQPHRMNRADIEAGVTAYVAAIVTGGDLLLPIGAVNRTRFVLALAQALWQPSVMRRLGEVEDLRRLTEANELAVMWREFRSSLTVRIGKADVRPPAVVMGSPWSETVAWVVRDIPADAARFFSSFRATNESWALTTHLPQVDAVRADAIAGGLLREARERQAYGASGQFVLALPEHLPWHEVGIVALAIHAQEDGLWVAGLTARSERTASWWWSPEMVTTDLLQHTLEAQPLVHATLAAFWHDLLVAGDEVIVSPGQRPRREAPPRQSDAPRSRHRPGDPVVVLPRRYVRYTGRREWATPEDREIITRRSHGVRGHLRELPEGWSRSLEAEGEAREWGFVLPEGYTFVRPHVRGGHDRDPAPVIAKARGLQTLSALL